MTVAPAVLTPPSRRVHGECFMKLRLCLALVLFVGTTETAFAQAVWIDHAVPNLPAQVITISGDAFGTTTPVVTLNTLQLTVVTFSQTQIIAVLPGSVVATPGTYQLAVGQVGKKGLITGSATLDVTIGAV